VKPDMVYLFVIEPTPFSILLRIVRGETKAGANPSFNLKNFQYPLTDRAG